MPQAKRLKLGESGRGMIRFAQGSYFRSINRGKAVKLHVLLGNGRGWSAASVAMYKCHLPFRNLRQIVAATVTG